MPWTESDATRFTKKADTAAKRRRWANIANSVLSNGGSEASAIKQANVAMKKRHKYSTAMSG
jgi:uncharacterized protein YdaT